MFGEIFFYVLSIALFVIMFIKIMVKNDIINFTTLILQAIGILIRIIALIFKIELNWFFEILTWLVSVVVPLLLTVLEYKKINIADKIYIFLAKFYMLIKDNKTAKKILLALVEKNDKCTEAHKMLAEIYEKEGGIRKAIDEYVKVVDLDQNAYDSYFKIAMLLRELGNNEDSLDMLTKLVNKKPDYLEASIALSDMLCMNERYKEAISIMNEAAKYHPNNYDVYYSMGMIYTLLNDFSTAKSCYEKAAIINTLEHNSDYNIAMIELILGELEESEKYFTRCIDDEKLSPLAYYQLAKIYMIRGQKETAIQALNIAIELDKKMYKKAVEDRVFIPIKGYIDYPNMDEDEEEIAQDEVEEKIEKEDFIRKHLEDTYDLVGQLNYKELGIKYNNNTKEIFEDRQRD